MTLSNHWWRWPLLQRVQRFIRLMPNIVVLTYRNPFLVPKAGAAVDLLSGGRFTLAVGVGYLKREFAALGVDYEKRTNSFEEALDVIRDIWTNDSVSFEGQTFTARGITAHPRPVSDPYPPIWIEGNTGAARDRVAKRGDGWSLSPHLPGWPTQFRLRPWILSGALLLASMICVAGSTPRGGTGRTSISPLPTGPGAIRVPLTSTRMPTRTDWTGRRR